MQSLQSSKSITPQIQSHALQLKQSQQQSDANQIKQTQINHHKQLQNTTNQRLNELLNNAAAQQSKSSNLNLHQTFRHKHQQITPS